MCDTACTIAVLIESYKFYKTSQNNVLAEERGFGLDYTTSSFHPGIFLNILRYALLLEKFC